MESTLLHPPAETTTRQIEAAFKEFTSREDIAILLISQNVANMIRTAVDQHQKVCLRLWSCCAHGPGLAWALARMGLGSSGWCISDTRNSSSSRPRGHLL